MLSESDISGLLVLAGKLFPRETSERISLIETAALSQFYDAQVCNAQLRIHAGTHEFLNLPRLAEAMRNAHADREARVREINEALSRKADQLRGEKAKADAAREWEAAEFSELLRLDRERVEELFASYVTLNPKAPATVRGMPKTVDHCLSHLKAWIVGQMRQPA